MSNRSDLPGYYRNTPRSTSCTLAPSVEAAERALRHRMMNLVSVIQAIIRLSAREATDVARYADQLSHRVNALALAHRGTGGTAGTGLRALATAVIAPHTPSGRAPALDGPDLAISDQAITSLALILHELAAKARLSGAWAVQDGAVTVCWTAATDDTPDSPHLRLIWTETGHGLSSARPDTDFTGTDGFSALLLRSSVTQLGGTMSSETAPGLLRYTLNLRV